MKTHHFTYKSPLGEMVGCGDDDKLYSLDFSEYVKIDNIKDNSSDVSKRTALWLDEYFSGGNPAVPDFLSPHASEFTRLVADKLLKIPHGKLSTYGDIANELSMEGRKSSPRAVGGAVGRNPIVIIIPCHRVIGADASLTGFSCGIERKKYLLELEGHEVSDGIVTDFESKRFK